MSDIPKPDGDPRNPFAEQLPNTPVREVQEAFDMLAGEFAQFLRARGMSAVVAIHAYDPLGNREAMDIRTVGSQITCAGLASVIGNGMGTACALAQLELEPQSMYGSLDEKDIPLLESACEDSIVRMVGVIEEVIEEGDDAEDDSELT